MQLFQKAIRRDQGPALPRRLIDSNMPRLPLVAELERLDSTRKALDIYTSHLFA